MRTTEEKMKNTPPKVLPMVKKMKKPSLNEEGRI